MVVKNESQKASFNRIESPSQMIARQRMLDASEERKLTNPQLKQSQYKLVRLPNGDEILKKRIPDVSVDCGQVLGRGHKPDDLPPAWAPQPNSSLAEQKKESTTPMNKQSQYKLMRLPNGEEILKKKTPDMSVSCGQVLGRGDLQNYSPQGWIPQRNMNSFEQKKVTTTPVNKESQYKLVRLPSGEEILKKKIPDVRRSCGQVLGRGEGPNNFQNGGKPT